MKNCTKCRYAEWYRTESGRLSPSGDGKCKYPYKLPALPSAFYWLGRAEIPCGGRINRREELKDHCPYYGEDDG